MAFCCPDLCKSRAWDAYSIDIIIQHGKLGRDPRRSSFSRLAKNCCRSATDPEAVIKTRARRAPKADIKDAALGLLVCLCAAPNCDCQRCTGGNISLRRRLTASLGMLAMRAA